MRILVVDDDQQSLSSTSRILEHAGFEVCTSESGQTALTLLDQQGFDLVVTDVRMPGMTGMEFVEKYQKNGHQVPFVIMTAFGEVQDAVWAMKMGAVDFLLKPFKKHELLQAVDHIHLRKKNQADSSAYLGSSLMVKRLKEQIHKVATTDATVLVLGESGTGKELIAKLIHANSKRSEAPFIAVNCAAIPEGLMESELFGYEKGAFTGASQAKVGLIEAAHQGTLLLDEIGDMPLALQPKLLRVLENQTFRRLGSHVEKAVNMRVIAATHQNLLHKVEAGLFRQDLYYRLNVMTITSPALKERAEDIPELTQYFLKKYATEYKKDIQGIDTEAQARLMEHAWPGNVRELSNVLERAVILSADSYIRAIDLPITLHQGSSSFSEHIRIPLGTSLKAMEDLLIEKTLVMTKGDRSQAAKLLGVNERTIYRKISSRSKEE